MITVIHIQIRKDIITVFGRKKTEKIVQIDARYLLDLSDSHQATSSHMLPP